MGKTITVKTTPAQVLRDSIQLAKKRAGDEDTFDRQARALDELGYAIVAKAGDALGPVGVELPEPDEHEVMDCDDGRSTSVPAWSLHSAAVLEDAVYAWPDGVDVAGDLTLGEESLRQLERDALKVLAAIATHRRMARRATAVEGGASDGS